MARSLIFTSLALLLSFSYSCNKEDLISKGSAEFSFSVYESEDPSLKSTETEARADISSIVLSITNELGQPVCEDKVIKLFKFNNEYISEPLPLRPDVYQLTKFLVINNKDSIVYATPIEDSPLAYLIKNPLPVEFVIEKDAVTKVIPEVLSTEEKIPNDFGYATFGISEVDIFDFLVAVFVYNEKIENFELTTANICIASQEDILYANELQAVTNKITIKDHYPVYKLAISKPGYTSFKAEFSADSLKKHFSIPLTVILQVSEKLEEGLIAYYPFDGDVNDQSGYDNHCIDSTEGIYADGVSGKALFFNGLSDFLELTNTLDGSKGLTFSFWVKSKGVQEGEKNGTVICKYNMYTDYTCFHIGTQGFNNNISALHGNFYVSRNSTDYRDCAWSEWQTIEDIPEVFNPQYYTIYNPQEITLCKWTHCVINVSENEIQAWINGVICSKKTREYAEYLEDPSEPTYIGNNMYGGLGSNNHYHGWLDELRVYNRGLTPDEIQLLYQQKK